jgi:hypothetical protein
MLAQHLKWDAEVHLRPGAVGGPSGCVSGCGEGEASAVAERERSEALRQLGGLLGFPLAKRYHLNSWQQAPQLIAVDDVAVSLKPGEDFAPVHGAHGNSALLRQERGLQFVTAPLPEEQRQSG